MTTAILFSIFLIHIANASPLGKVIEVCLVCAETGEPIPDGFGVTLMDDMGTPLTTEYTIAGCVEFGSGLPDGTYYITYYWNEPFRHEITIDCSQIIWHFDYRVPNPTITKHFLYSGLDIPIVGLEVVLDEDGVDIASAFTDASGTVVFGGALVDVCKVYTLEWMWGSDPYTEGPIHFEYVSGELLVCAWEATNYLEPKSGGGIIKADVCVVRVRALHQQINIHSML
jgi:hypothetical protein